jgi:excisionase family DNA binding protein
MPARWSRPAVRFQEVPSMPDSLLRHGYTTHEISGLLRVNVNKVREWIKAGELGALNTAVSGRKRFIVLPEHLAAFQQARAVAVQSPLP